MPVTEGTDSLPLDASTVKQMGLKRPDGNLYFPLADASGNHLTADALLYALIALVIDQVNGRSRVETNTFHYTEDSIAVLGEDVLFATATLTTTGATQIVAAPAAGNHHVIKKLSYQLREDVDTTATLRGGSGGTDVMAYDLDYTGANGPPVVGLDFGSGGYPLATATAIHGKLSAAPSTGGVRFNVWYVTRPD
jgi:hypothetical protein